MHAITDGKNILPPRSNRCKLPGGCAATVVGIRLFPGPACAPPSPPGDRLAAHPRRASLGTPGRPPTRLRL